MIKERQEAIDYGVCRLAIVSVRNQPKEDARQITELLFGDHYEVFQTSDDCDWLLIRIHYDKSEGWIEKEQHHSITREYFDQINHANFKITTDLTCSILYKKSPITILLGSIVPISNSELFKIEEQFAFNGEAKSLGQKRDFEFIDAIAYKYLNAPHLRGGRSPFGIDAIGLVQMIYKIAGYLLPVSLSAQLNELKKVTSIDDHKPGDLIYFTRKDAEVTHVGMALKDQKVIHVDGKVRIDLITHEGLVRADNKVLTHHVKEIRRVLAV